MSSFLARIMDGVNVTSEKLFTQYQGVCVQYNVDLLDTWGGSYLYHDWGKRYFFQSQSNSRVSIVCLYVCRAFSKPHNSSILIQASSSVIKRHQASSSVIKRHQASSSVIKRHQASSSVIKRHQASSSVIKRHQAS